MSVNKKKIIAVCLFGAVVALCIHYGGRRHSVGVASTALQEGEGFRPPLMVALSFDDNYDRDGMAWATDLLAGRRNADGSSVHVSFMVVTAALDKGGEALRREWMKALAGGHELGNHTHDHNMNRDAKAMAEAEWRQTISRCHTVLTDPAGNGGLGLKTVWGFRAPRGELNDSVTKILGEMGYAYDSSRPGHWSADGKWPEKVPGTEMWELAVSWLEPVPEAMGFVRRLLVALGFPQMVLGGDMSMFDPDSANMTKDQAVATLKRNIDRRLKGARAPLVFVGHTPVMAAAADRELKWKTNARQRREFYREFLDYATGLSEVRVVSNKELVDWLNAGNSP